MGFWGAAVFWAAPGAGVGAGDHDKSTLDSNLRPRVPKL